MKSKIKKILASFLLTIIITVIFSASEFTELGIISPYVGLLYVLGLLFGPYGALGATLANLVIDFYTGYSPMHIIYSAVFSFGISYLAYKLWYSGFKTNKITKPTLDNIYHLLLFISIIFICGFIYSTFEGYLIGLFINETLIEYQFFTFFLNFINISFVFGIVGIWLSKRINWINIPKKSERHTNRKLYRIIFISLMIVTTITVLSLAVEINKIPINVELMAMGILLFAYLTKPFEYEIEANDENTIIEKIIKNFLIIILLISILGMIITFINYNFIENIESLNIYMFIMPGLIITDVTITLFLIPGIIILRYIEQKVVKPISSFSEIEKFIQENEKIEAEGLIDIYSQYLNESNEIGTLARSYTDLINHNNNYIENIHEIESEKERMNAELDIATRIQAASLPTEYIETDDFIVNGYSKPAKEVGGDFLDYYQLDDDNLAIVIGDASGKGVPAALIAMITQVMIKQQLKHDNDPSKVIYTINNQLCENNPELMFLTLWLGIYNRTTNKLTFSNAGHNPPLIIEDNEFKYLNMDSGIAIGVMEDFEYVREEFTLKDRLVLYTDGITDAHNNNKEMYGEDRLLNFFNEFEGDGDSIDSLLDEIGEFTKGQPQFDDMTLLYLRIK